MEKTRPGKAGRLPAQDGGSALRGRHGLNLCTAPGRKWLSASPLCLLAYPDRNGVILVVNKHSLLFDGGGGNQEATSGTAASAGDRSRPSVAFLVAARAPAPPGPSDSTS